MADDRRPRLLVLATGGTIAGTAESSIGLSYRSASVGVEALLETVARAGLDVDVVGEQLASVGSQDMSAAIWRRLDARITQARADPSIDGIVVIHGTDTLEETAFLLDLVQPAGRPIVLVGAMRPANALGADGPRNIACAVRVAIDPAACGRGVLAVMGDTIHAARALRKSHTSAVDGFRSVPGGPIGSVTPMGAAFLGDPRAPAGAGRFRLPADPLPAVAILYAHADMDRSMVDAVRWRGVRGIVLAGLGNGNASAPMLAALAECARGGLAVVRATRIGEGLLEPGVEVDDQALGFVVARDLTPHASRILLQLLIAAGVEGRADLQAAFDAR